MTCEAAHHADKMGRCLYPADSGTDLTRNTRANTGTVAVSRSGLKTYVNLRPCFRDSATRIALGEENV